MKRAFSLKDTRGFTLIELLTVISIIGVLATIGTISLNGARQKARDAKRLSDVRQMALALEVHESGQPATQMNCSAYPLATSCGVTGDLTWTNFKDPSRKTTTSCSASNPGNTCEYTIGNTDSTSFRTNNYEICFVTEDASSVGPKGIYRMVSGGAIQPGCSR